MRETRLEIVPVGAVESALTDPASAPKQGHEGAPDAWLVFDPAVLEGLDGIRPGDRVVVLTWLDRARRDVLRVHPRDDPANPEQGVFNTRSADRPNPIGLHEVEIAAIDGQSSRAESRSLGRDADRRRQAGARPHVKRRPVRPPASRRPRP